MTLCCDLLEEDEDEEDEDVDEEEEEDERKKNRGLLEMLSQLPGRRGREKTNGYLHTQLRALVSRQHLCLWREDHVLLGLSEGHLEIILDVLATGVKETRRRRGERRWVRRNRSLKVMQHMFILA